MICFECGSSDDVQDHHVVPRSLGGKKTLPLCGVCHGKVHSKDLTSVSSLIRAVLQHKRAKGELVGGVPYGFKVAADGKHLVEDEAEQAVIAWVRGSRATGMSLRMIARELERQGMLSRNGKSFAATQINRMVLQ